MALYDVYDLSIAFDLNIPCAITIRIGWFYGLVMKIRHAAEI